MTIKLKVPAAPKFEIVGQGNLQVRLVPNSTIELEDRRFADWLIRTHELKEIKPRKKEEKPEEDSFGYPADFPGRAALIAAKIPFETTLGLTAEQLATIPGIGSETASQIVSITTVASPVIDSVETVEENSDADDNDGDGEQGGNEENGGAV